MTEYGFTHNLAEQCIVEFQELHTQANLYVHDYHTVSNCTCRYCQELVNSEVEKVGEYD